ncbi:MAG: putative surface protein with fasciclin (FAS1) repeats [Saprospiraceae bacterium]|jgi:uncharacterized surface protein with fasciclin (FAS1) repeats
MKNLFKIGFVLFALVLASCSDDDDNQVAPPQTNTIVDIVVGNPDFSTLGSALAITNLTSVLESDGPFTVFAPTNDAFADFLTANGFASLEEVPVDVLASTLLNHVVGGVNNAADLTTGYINTSASFNAEPDAPLSMYVNTTEGVMLNGMSSVTTADVSADNGVIHIVDAVITLPTVVTFAAADAATFSELVGALTRADQPDYLSVLTTANGTEPAPFTVFAPTNQAFADLYAELGVAGIDDVDGGVLTATLNTHVIAGANVRAEDLVSGSVTTLGDALEIDATTAIITDPNGRTSQVIVTNVQAANGVIHAIDTVLLPQL